MNAERDVPSSGLRHSSWKSGKKIFRSLSTTSKKKKTKNGMNEKSHIFCLNGIDRRHWRKHISNV